MQVLVRLRRLKRTLSRREEWLSLGAWVLVLALVHAVGPSSPSDTVDGILLAGLIAGALTTARVHRTHDLRWVAALGDGLRAVRARLAAHEVPMGFDLRESPRLRRGMPLPLRVLPAVALGLLLGTTLAAPHLPGGLRELAGRAYLPYLLLLVALWSACGLGILMGIGMAIAALNDRLAGVLDHRARVRRVRREVGAILLGLAALATLLPAHHAAYASAALLLALLLLIAAGPLRPAFLWVDGGGERRVVSCRAFGLAVAVGIGGLTLAPLVVGLGEEAFGQSSEGSSTMGMTRILAGAFAWVSLPLALTTLVQTHLFLRRSGRLERGRRARPVLRLEGRPTEEDRDAVRRLGWRLAGREATPGELRLRVEPGARLPDPLFGPTLPAVVPPGWLTREEAGRRLGRRRVHGLRRAVERGIRRALKAVAGREFVRGSGYFVTPHLWFTSGLTRDEREMDGEHERGDPVLEPRLGPPWEHVMSWEARAYLADVLAALELDLIFVEDGVGHRRLIRVLRTLFEVHDTHGSRRIEERQLSLVPGVRVVVQDEAGLDAPLLRTGYPEPSYRDLGRARLLLVFRDRGGESDRVEAPVDADDRPVPVLTG